MQRRMWGAMGAMAAMALVAMAEVLTGVSPVSSVSSFTSAGDGEAGSGAFRAQLDEITALLDRGSYAEADRALQLILEDDRLQGEAMQAGDEIRESATRCAFGLSYREPEVADLLGVESAVWNRRSGRLEMTFDHRSTRHEGAPTEVADDASVYAFHPRGFSLVDGALLLDVPFSGRCQISVSGRLPGHAKDRKRPPQLVLRVDDQLSYTVDYTWPSTYRKSRGLWSQGTIYEWRAGVSELLATDRTPGGKYDMMWGERYDLKLVVKGGALAASLQGYGMLSAPKIRSVYGWLGFRWCPSVDQVIVSGIVERDVFESLCAAHRERAYTAFVGSADALGLLPTWLRKPDG